MGTISGFYQGEDKVVTIEVTYNGATPDITGDTITLRVKKIRTDTEILITKVADVSAPGGLTGTAIFTLFGSEVELPDTPDTDIEVGIYHCGIEWITSDKRRYILYDKTIECYKSVSDI